MRTASILAVALVLPACVTKRQYDALGHDLATTRTELAEHEKTEAKHRALAERYGAELVGTKNRIDQLEQDAEMLRMQRDASAAELASVVKDRANLEDSVDNMRLALAQMAARQLAAQARVAEYQALLARFKALIDAGTLRVKIVDGKMVLQLPSDVLFPTGSAKLSDPGREALQEIGGVLAEMPKRQFQVEGHTDNVPIHNSRYASNWELGAARARGVVRTLVDAGVAPEQLSAASYGEFHPVASNDTEEGRQLNRRIEIVLQPDLSLLPGADELGRLARG